MKLPERSAGVSWDGLSLTRGPVILRVSANLDGDAEGTELEMGGGSHAIWARPAEKSESSLDSE